MSTSSSALLQLQQFGVSFGKRVVLADITLDLPGTGVDVLMGPAKTGKSTLLLTLAGRNQGNSLHRSWGGALLDGQPLQHTGEILLVQQHAAILNLSVRDALIFHVRQRSEKTSHAWTDFAVAVLHDYELDHLIPQLLSPLLSLPTHWQRAVNILSHALSQPRLLLLDEPISGFPDHESGQIIKWLKKLGTRQKLLVALNHQGFAKVFADRTTLIGGGRVLAHTDTEGFFSKKVNSWVDQFVSTGSLDIAFPDATPEEFIQRVSIPPPLPAGTLQEPSGRVNRASSSGSVPETMDRPDSKRRSVSSKLDTVSAKPKVESTPSVSLRPQSKALVSDAITASAEKQSASPSNKSLSKRRLAALPPTSALAVEDASMVGRVILSNSRGPHGFFWIVPGKLAGCPEPGVTDPIEYDLDMLVSMGVTYLITLTENDLNQHALIATGVHNIHFPIVDREAPSISQTYMLVRRMQQLIDKGEVVAVHCKTGIERTGTVLASWLIREGGLSAASAIDGLRKINPAYVQSTVQEKFLHEFENDLMRRRQQSVREDS